MAFAGVLDQIRNIFVSLASDEETAIIEKIGGRLPRCFPAFAVVAP